MKPYPQHRTFWRRFWAGLIDGLLFQPLFWLDQWVWKAVAAPSMLVAWFVMSSLAMLAYSIILHGLFGQTLGKRLTGVKVYGLSGQRLSMRQALARDSVLLVLVLFGVAVDLPTVASGRNPYDPATVSFSNLSVLQLIPLWGSLFWFLLEVATMTTNPQRRAVHDFLAASVVVRVDVPTGDADADGASRRRLE